MPSLVILIENVSTADAERAWRGVNAAVDGQEGSSVKLWTYQSASLPREIEETCARTHTADLEANHGLSR